MMTFQSVWAEERMNWYILVWDTETGNSKMYYGNGSDGMNPANGKYNLPSSPL